MPMHKVTTFLSEISSFFRKNSAGSAMFTIMEVIKGINMSEKVLFGRTSRCNKVYSLLQVLQTLLVYPCFMIRNPYNFDRTALGRFVGCKKDVFYRFMNDAGIDWRKVGYHTSLQLWRKMTVRSDHQGTTTCLIIDDTDFPKTGRRMESIGRVHSHLLHKAILGYKALFLGITDGVSQMVLDFAILGEKGSRGNFGMSAKDLASRFTRERGEGCPLQERLGEYTMKKTDLTIEMVRRAIRHGVRFRYLLADSWFACASVVRFIVSRHIGCDYLGMIKIGEDSRTKYHFEGKDVNAPSIVKTLKKRKAVRYSRKLGCWYASAEVTFAGVRVRLFFIRRSQHGPWNGLMTTDLRLGFFEAYRIYSQRWALEVVFKESKGLLGLGKCQSNDFAAQIASTTLVCMQYNVLSVVKRFNAYETMGELFRRAGQDTLELTITERIWGAMLEFVAAMADIFGFDDQEVFDAVINKSEELAHVCDLYRLKMAS